MLMIRFRNFTWLRIPMRKRSIALLLLVPSIAFSQQPTDFSKVQINVTKVSGNIYLLQGAGGNIAASLGDVCRHSGSPGPALHSTAGLIPNQEPARLSA
jgi:hypothetical protein